MDITVRFGPWLVIVSRKESAPIWRICLTRNLIWAAKSEFLVSGSADNMMKLWRISTGECLYTWEFPTAIKRVSWT